MGDHFYSWLERLAIGLQWLGRTEDAKIIFRLSKKCEECKIDSLDNLIDAISKYENNNKEKNN